MPARRLPFGYRQKLGICQPAPTDVIKLGSLQHVGRCPRRHWVAAVVYPRHACLPRVDFDVMPQGVGDQRLAGSERNKSVRAVVGSCLVGYGVVHQGVGPFHFV